MANNCLSVLFVRSCPLNSLSLLKTINSFNSLKPKWQTIVYLFFLFVRALVAMKLLFFDHYFVNSLKPKWQIIVYLFFYFVRALCILCLYSKESTLCYLFEAEMANNQIFIIFVRSCN